MTPRRTNRNPDIVPVAPTAAVVFRNLPVAETRIEYSDAGRISAATLMRMLEPTHGTLVRLRFRASLTGTPNTAAWEALDKNANVIAGRLTLHAGVSESEVTSWAEVMINDDGDARAAVRVAVRYMRDSGGLVPMDEEDNEPVNDEAEKKAATLGG
jgi:hypothetical protein